MCYVCATLNFLETLNIAVKSLICISKKVLYYNEIRKNKKTLKILHSQTKINLSLSEVHFIYSKIIHNCKTRTYNKIIS